MNIFIIIILYLISGFIILNLIYNQKSFVDRLLWHIEKDSNLPEMPITETQMKISVFILSLLSCPFWPIVVFFKIKKGITFGLRDDEEIQYRKERGRSAII